MAGGSDWAGLWKNELYQGGDQEPLEIFEKGWGVIISIPWEN